MNTKKELKHFFIWLRNGTCFAVTWFLILELMVMWISGADTVSVVNLTKTILWTVGGVLIFCVAFTRLFVIAARKAAHYEANKEKIAARQAAYREANKEKIAARRKAKQETLTI